MSRQAHQGTWKDQNGSIVEGGTVTVYLAGTTTIAKIYSASSGGSAIASGQVLSAATSGKFIFYVDEDDYEGTQLFKIVLSKTNFQSIPYDDINILYQPWNSSVVTIKETTTPDAVDNVGKVYCKADNKLYFQDGAGIEHEMAFV